jgi:hypothetical protein
VKESDEDKKLGCKMVWHILAEETVSFKLRTFFVSKGEMQQEKTQTSNQNYLVRQQRQKLDADHSGSFKRLEG